MSTRSIVRAGALVGIAAAAVLSAAPAAGAQTVHRYAPIQPGAHGLVQGKNIDGGNWSGYVTRRGGNFRTVVAQWTEPSVTCNSSRDLFAPWVGIDGYGSQTVEQTGVETDCSSGSPQYAGWFEMYPAAPVYYGNAVSAGDHFIARVGRNASTYTLTLTDTTKGWKKTTVRNLNARNASAEVIMESPTAAYPNFGRVNFTAAHVNGATLGSFNPTALDASNSGGFEDHTSALTNGVAFHIDYLRE